MSGRTLLGVWAHPDDEAYLTAGLMLEHRARGDRLVLVRETLGERGTSDPVTWPPSRLVGHRHAELTASLAVLDVHDLRVLGFEDGGCAAFDGADLVIEQIEDVRPDVIVTFGPDGMTGHPDHRAVSRWTTDAWRSAESDAELWYATVTPRFHEEWGPINDAIGLWADQPAPPSTIAAELCHVVELSASQLDVKLAALAEHHSQTAPLAELMGADAYRRWWATETFRAAGRGGVEGSGVVESSSRLVTVGASCRA
jgi:LmbE family N-acetylglucosaminyl deacetylase